MRSCRNPNNGSILTSFLTSSLLAFSACAVLASTLSAHPRGWSNIINGVGRRGPHVATGSCRCGDRLRAEDCVDSAAVARSVREANGDRTVW